MDIVVAISSGDSVVAVEAISTGTPQEGVVPFVAPKVSSPALPTRTFVKRLPSMESPLVPPRAFSMTASVLEMLRKFWPEDASLLPAICLRSTDPELVRRPGG